MSFHIIKLRRTIKVDTNRLRGKSLQTLEKLFRMAKKLAEDKNLSLSQRLKWTRVCAYICQVINSVASGFDEKQIDVQLDELERLVDEAKAKAEVKQTKRSSVGEKREKASRGSS